jgi:hypothetical protein
MKKIFAAMTAALLMVALVSSAALAAPGGGKGNSAQAQLCKNGGYANEIGSSRQTFATQDACVSYVVGGGTLSPKQQMTITSDSLYNSTNVNVSFAGLYWQPSETITMTSVIEYGVVDTTGYLLGTTDFQGAITVPNGSWIDNCNNGTTVLTTDQLITITFSGSLGDVVTATGTLACHLLATP